MAIPSVEYTFSLAARLLSVLAILQCIHCVCGAAIAGGNHLKQHSVKGITAPNEYEFRLCPDTLRKPLPLSLLCINKSDRSLLLTIYSANGLSSNALRFVGGFVRSPDKDAAFRPTEHSLVSTILRDCSSLVAPFGWGDNNNGKNPRRQSGKDATNVYSCCRNAEEPIQIVNIAHHLIQNQPSIGIAINAVSDDFSHACYQNIGTANLYSAPGNEAEPSPTSTTKTDTQSSGESPSGFEVAHTPGSTTTTRSHEQPGQVVNESLQDANDENDRSDCLDENDPSCDLDFARDEDN